MTDERALIDEAWAALTADDDVTAPAVERSGASTDLASRFPVRDAAVATIAAALAAGGSLEQQRTGRTPMLALDRRHVSVAVRSERSFSTGSGSTGMGFAPLSRFWPTRDGWLRTHANYSWHRDALLAVLDVPNDADAVAAAISARPAAELEQEIVAAGGVAAAVRALDAWRQHPQGAAVHAEPLISHRAVPGAPPRTTGDGAAGGPMAGVRVLDLTRVIAGPVCTRFLGALGADVLRLDPVHRPDLELGQVGDTLLAKRSAVADLRADGAVGVLHSLLDEADVLVSGYRPGSLDRFGLGEDDLIDRHPGLVVVTLGAWGHTGPWAGRRGFDSVVQAPTGIAAGEGAGDGSPGALPCQLLDHGTGYLAAAAALDGLRRQRRGGGTHVRRLSLARTAAWLTSRPPSGDGPAPGDGADDDPGPWLQILDGSGAVQAVRPPGAIDGRVLAWPAPLARYGQGSPCWSV